MAEPDNLVLTLLREMRRAMDERFDTVDARFAQNDKKLEAIREALKSEMIMGRYIVNGVDDRLDDLEKRVAAIEAGR